MARPRKPSKILERSGAFRHNPQRRRRDARGVGTLPPEAPMHLELTRHEALAWKELAAVIPPGVVTNSECFLVEMAARTIGRVRKTGECSPALLGQLRLYLGSLGLTPSDRARLATPEEESDDDGFGEFSRPSEPRPSGAKLLLGSLGLTPSDRARPSEHRPVGAKRKRKAKALKFPDPESR